MEGIFKLLESNSHQELHTVLSSNVKLLKKVVNFRSNGVRNTILMLACLHRQREVVRVLVSLCRLLVFKDSVNFDGECRFWKLLSPDRADSEPNSTMDYILCRNVHGDTAVHFSACSGDADSLAELGIVAGLPLLNKSQMTPVMVTVRNGHLGTYLFMMNLWQEFCKQSSSNASLRMQLFSKDTSSETALHIAIRCGQWWIAQHICQTFSVAWDSGDLVNQDQKTPKDLFHELWSGSPEKPSSFEHTMSTNWVAEIGLQVDTIEESGGDVPSELAEMGIEDRHLSGGRLQELSAGQLEVLHRFLHSVCLQISDERVKRAEGVLSDL